MGHREILFVAGETSGDLHASAVAEELTRLRPEVVMSGVGGDRMAAAGVKLLAHSGSLAVMGLVEVVRHIPAHLSLLKELRTRMESGVVGLVVLVDYPGFNMRVAAAAAKAGVPVLYYITPQVWAWRSNRVHALRELVTRAAVILPFEEELLRRHGVNATFVGHPLLDRMATLPDRDAARQQLGVPADAPVLALFPGSRHQEIRRHLHDFLETADELAARVPGLHVLLSAAAGIRLTVHRNNMSVVSGASGAVLRAADAAMCKSGTSTLEAAVAGCPMVVAYRTNAFTYAIARRLVRIPHIGLVNVVAGEEIAREFVQGALSPRAVADALQPLLDRTGAERSLAVERLSQVRARLGTEGAARRVAVMASELVP